MRRRVELHPNEEAGIRLHLEVFGDKPTRGNGLLPAETRMSNHSPLDLKVVREAAARGAVRMHVPFFGRLGHFVPAGEARSVCGFWPVVKWPPATDRPHQYRPCASCVARLLRAGFNVAAGVVVAQP